MVKVRELFRDTDATEFVIVTIPTVRSHIVPFLFIFFNLYLKAEAFFLSFVPKDS